MGSAGEPRLAPFLTRLIDGPSKALGLAAMAALRPLLPEIAGRPPDDRLRKETLDGLVGAARTRPDWIATLVTDVQTPLTPAVLRRLGRGRAEQVFAVRDVLDRIEDTATRDELRELVARDARLEDKVCDAVFGKDVKRLVKLGGSAVDLLVRGLDGDQPSWVCAEALGLIGDRRAVEPLGEALLRARAAEPGPHVSEADRKWELQLFVKKGVAALVAMDCPDSRSYLRRALKRGAAGEAAAVALGNLGDPAAFRTLRAMLPHGVSTGAFHSLLEQSVDKLSTDELLEVLGLKEMHEWLYAADDWTPSDEWLWKPDHVQDLARAELRWRGAFPQDAT